jgi:hypothetical protein
MKGKVALLIITVWLAVSVAAADAGSGHGQSAIAGSGTLITRDPLSGIYEEKAAADLNRKAFLEKRQAPTRALMVRLLLGSSVRWRCLRWIAGRWRRISLASQRTRGHWPGTARWLWLSVLAHRRQAAELDAAVKEVGENIPSLQDDLANLNG